MRALSNMYGGSNMNMKLLFIINDNEKKLNTLVNKLHLPFNAIMYGDGTATQGILDFLGLSKSKKNILTSIIPDIMEKDIFNYLNDNTKINEIGKGVAFTVPLSSSSKYIMEAFKDKVGDKMENSNKYHLIITIVREGYADSVMQVAKKNGANGGTLIKGRSIGSKSAFKFFNMTVEPEKDILLIICQDVNKNKIMESILDKNGASTDAKGMCISMPIDNIVGINE